MHRPHGNRRLRAILAAELEAQFRRCGWSAEAPGAARDERAPWRLGSFRRAIGADFIATAEVVRVPLARRPDGRLELALLDVNVTALVGIAYLPARRLAVAIGAPPWLGGAELDLLLAVSDDALAPLALTRGRHAAVATPEQARELAGTLARLATATAPVIAARFASVDALVAHARAGRGREELPGELAAAVLLGAAERASAARAALAALPLARDSRARRRVELRRLAWRLAQRLDERGAAPAPPPVAPAPAGLSALGGLWREARRRSHAQRRAYRVVRRRARRISPDQLRGELAAALAMRSAQREPLWVERAAERLGASPTERLRGAVARGRELAAALRAARRGAAGDGAALEPPAWLDPPGRAAFAVPHEPGADRVLVALAPGAHEHLERAHAALVATVTPRVAVWLAWDPEPRTPGSLLAAHIGPCRVGALDRESTAATAALMDVAAARGELPVLEGTLHRRAADGRFFLEIPLPTGTRARG